MSVSCSDGERKRSRAMLGRERDLVHCWGEKENVSLMFCWGEKEISCSVGERKRSRAVLGRERDLVHCWGEKENLSLVLCWGEKENVSLVLCFSKDRMTIPYKYIVCERNVQFPALFCRERER